MDLPFSNFYSDKPIDELIEFMQYKLEDFKTLPKQKNPKISIPSSQLPIPVRIEFNAESAHAIVPKFISSKKPKWKTTKRKRLRKIRKQSSFMKPPIFQTNGIKLMKSLPKNFEIAYNRKYNRSERNILIGRLKYKNTTRSFKKKIRYNCRSDFANARPRVGGRFIAASK